MSNSMRLKKPMGLLVDHKKTVNFEFDGLQYEGLEGDSIASALVANKRWLMSRSFKYHRARGPLTMAGQDANTMVQPVPFSTLTLPTTYAVPSMVVLVSSI